MFPYRLQVCCASMGMRSQLAKAILIFLFLARLKGHCHPASSTGKLQFRIVPQLPFRASCNFGLSESQIWSKLTEFIDPQCNN